MLYVAINTKPFAVPYGISYCHRDNSRYVDSLRLSRLTLGILGNYLTATVKRERGREAANGNLVHSFGDALERIIGITALMRVSCILRRGNAWKRCRGKGSKVTNC